MSTITLEGRGRKGDKGNVSTYDQVLTILKSERFNTKITLLVAHFHSIDLHKLTSPGMPLNMRRLLTFLRWIGETMRSMKDFPAAVGSVQKSTPGTKTFQLQGEQEGSREASPSE